VFIIIVILFPVYLCGQDSISVYDQKVNQFRLKIGMDLDAKFNNSSYSLLVKKLDSLGVIDEQLEDGFVWGGRKFGFEIYILNNIDTLLSYFKKKVLAEDKTKKDLEKKATKK